MDVWYMVKERYIFVSIFIVMILLSLLMFVAIWKNRSSMSKSLFAVVTVISVMVIVLSVVALIFVVSFGYNS